MTVQEMHIGIDQFLQKVNSNYIDSFSDEEKDYHLSIEQERFIKTRISGNNIQRLGYQYTQKRYDDLQELITTFESNAFIKDTNTQYINLPPNYMALDSDRSLVDDLCNGNFAALTPLNQTVYYSFIAVEDDVDLYSVFSIAINGITVFDITDYPGLTFFNSSDKFMLISLIRTELNRLGYTVYYENWNGFYYPNQLFFVNETTNFNSVKFTYNSFFNLKSTTSVVLQRYLGIGKEVPNRLTKTSDLYEILRTNFGKSTAYSPVSSLEKTQLLVHHRQNFICTKIRLSYIRKPQPIILSLSQNCELSESVHEEIVELCAKRLAGLLEARNYNVMANENNEKE